MRKRPARNPEPSRQCAGHEGEICVFNLSNPLQIARIQPMRGETHCLFCSADMYKKQSSMPKRPDRRALKALKRT
eukprot:4428142-Karenia_brevis.AAC.1